MITANPSPAPEEYLPKIRECLTAIQVSEDNALQRAIACGRLLASAHAALDEANAKLSKSKQTTWGGWLAENLKEFGIKLSTANAYVRSYENSDDVKDAKSISEARAKLPPERRRKLDDVGDDAGDKSDDADDDDKSNDADPIEELSDKDREQVAAQYLRSGGTRKLYDQLIGILDDKELFELYQLLGERFNKSAPALATAVASQSAAAPAIARRV